MNLETTNIISLLILDDNPIDQEIVAHLLKKSSTHLEIYSAADRENAEIILHEKRTDIAFIDYHLGYESGLDLIEKWKPRFKNTSFVLMTGCGDEKIIANALRVGAVDYIPKDNLDRATIQACLSRIIDKLWDSQQFQSILEASKAGILTFDENGKILLANRAMEELFQYSTNCWLDKRSYPGITSEHHSTSLRSEKTASKASHSNSQWSGLSSITNIRMNRVHHQFGMILVVFHK